MKLGWLIQVLCFIVSLGLIIGAASLRFRLFPSAQADFEIYLLIRSAGIGSALISVLTLLIGGLMNLKAIQFDWTLLKRPFVLVGLFNILGPFIAFWLLKQST